MAELPVCTSALLPDGHNGCVCLTFRPRAPWRRALCLLHLCILRPAVLTQTLSTDEISMTSQQKKKESSVWGSKCHLRNILASTSDRSRAGTLERLANNATGAIHRLVSNNSTYIQNKITSSANYTSPHCHSYNVPGPGYELLQASGSLIWKVNSDTRFYVLRTGLPVGRACPSAQSLHGLACQLLEWGPTPSPDPDTLRTKESCSLQPPRQLKCRP